MRGLAVLAIVALMVVPATGAQIQNPDESTPTTLYFHIFDVFNRFVINTQPMNDTFFVVGGTNFPTIPPTPLIADNGWDFNTMYGYSTAGPVEYDFIEDGRPRFHPEPGIAQDILIDDAVQPMVYFYFRAPAATGGSGTPGILPYLTLEVTMRTGDGPEADLDAGELIMQGSTTVHVVSDNGGVPAQTVFGAAPLDRPVVTPGPDGVFELAVPLEVFRPVIPKNEAYNIRIDWYQWSDAPVPVFEDDEFAQGNFKVVANADHLPRLEMNIMNPVYISFIHPQVAAGTLLIHAGVNSPWGTYDVDYDNITVRVEGPSAPRNVQRVVAANQHVHGLHHLDAEITYLWKFRDEGAANGQYTITMDVPNMAGTASARGTAGFTVEGRQAFGIDDTGNVVVPSGGEGNVESPGLVVPVIALLLFAMVQWRRREMA